MTCEEFEALGLDFSSDPARAAEAQAHLLSCSRCAAWLESWHELRADLRVLAQETQSAEAPASVEIALRKLVRSRQPASGRRRWVPLWTWGLVGTASAVLFVWFVSHTRRPPLAPAPGQTARLSPSAGNPSSEKGAVPGSGKSSGSEPANPSAGSSPYVSAADSSSNEEGFIALPYAGPTFEGEDASILRVRMQRSSLRALGLPVNEESAEEWVLVDLLVGADGEPQAVRLER